MFIMEIRLALNDNHVATLLLYIDNCLNFIQMFVLLVILILTLYSYTRLKNKIENTSAWEGALYQSEWVKMNSSWVILIFSFWMCTC